MDENIFEIRQLFRTDTLTGVGNMIGFYENLHSRLENEPNSPFSLISIDVYDLKKVNDNFGRSAGDSTLRWFALVLSEETKGDVYRIGGDEFAVILRDIAPETVRAVMKKLEKRFNEESHQGYLEPPVARIAVVNFSKITEWSLSRTMEILYSVLNKRKKFKANNYEIFEAHEIPNAEELDTSTMDMIEKLARVGELLDQSLEMAYTDSVSGLPNMNAALRYLNNLNEKLDQPNFVFSIFIIDGDNLGQYNKVSYQQGDYMIKKLGEILKQDVRPNDFVARWRSGDEFFVVLPGTGLEEAKNIGNRLRERIKETSQDWQFPVTISIGIVNYPNNGKTIEVLIDQGERALREAKAQGKDSVVTIN